MTYDEIKGIYDAFVSTAVETFDKNEQTPLMFYFVKKDEITAVPTTIVQSMSDRDQLSDFVKVAAKKWGAEYVITVSEAWVSNTLNDTRPVRERDDRSSIILVAIDGINLKGTTLIPIKDDRSLGEPTFYSSVATGRFTDLAGSSEFN
jgi:hypothetical protein